MLLLVKGCLTLISEKNDEKSDRRDSLGVLSALSVSSFLRWPGWLATPPPYGESVSQFYSHPAGLKPSSSLGWPESLHPDEGLERIEETGELGRQGDDDGTWQARSHRGQR